MLPQRMTMPRVACLSTAVLLLCAAGAHAADPSGGWLSYAVFKASTQAKQKCALHPPA